MHDAERCVSGFVGDGALSRIGVDEAHPICAGEVECLFDVLQDHHVEVVAQRHVLHSRCFGVITGHRRHNHLLRGLQQSLDCPGDHVLRCADLLRQDQVTVDNVFATLGDVAFDCVAAEHEVHALVDLVFECFLHAHLPSLDDGFGAAACCCAFSDVLVGDQDGAPACVWLSGWLLDAVDVIE